MSKKIEQKFIELKVYKNSRTGQRTVVLPKKIMHRDSKKIKFNGKLLKW